MPGARRGARWMGTSVFKESTCASALQAAFRADESGGDQCDLLPCTSESLCCGFDTISFLHKLPDDAIEESLGRSRTVSSLKWCRLSSSSNAIPGLVS